MKEYKTGIQGVNYRVVPEKWREDITVRQFRNGKRSPTNPMVLDLLEGKTIFAYTQDRKAIKFGSLYAVAASHNKQLRYYLYDDVEQGVHKGYLIWMEDKKIA